MREASSNRSIEGFREPRLWCCRIGPGLPNLETVFPMAEKESMAVDRTENGHSNILDWRFAQVFGERASPNEEVQDADLISAIEFDKSGNHLATGDRGGRVVLFSRVDDGSRASHIDQSKDFPASHSNILYKYSTEFQSHEPEFDYLKSVEIEEKINRIRWCHSSHGVRFLLSTNDKTIKLWKVYDKVVRHIADYLPDRNGKIPGRGISGIVMQPETALRVPKVIGRDTRVSAQCRRVYSNAHAYHINSISTNSDCETYLSADDLRINLWHMDVNDKSFNIVDIKPPNMEDLTEVITAAEFHPSHCHIFAYSSSKGNVRLADMRGAAICDQYAKLFEAPELSAARSFFSEIVASISDLKFVGSAGRHILTRDYMTLKLWDINMESRPLAVMNVHEHLRPKMCDLYENDSMFDKFECTSSNNAQHLATGSYSNLIKIHSLDANGSGTAEYFMEATRTPLRLRSAAAQSNSGAGSRWSQRFRTRSTNARIPNGDSGDILGADFANQPFDPHAKLLHMAWHPHQNLLAVAAANSLYLYQADGGHPNR